MNQSCKTCKYSKWERTPTGKISKLYGGKCLFKIELPILPSCVNSFINLNTENWKNRVWPNNGADCKVWEYKGDDF